MKKFFIKSLYSNKWRNQHKLSTILFISLQMNNRMISMLQLPDEYHLYLKLEKSLSDNTVDAYERDLLKLNQYLAEAHVRPEDADTEILRDFVIEIANLGIHPRSPARVISRIKTF